MIRLLTAAIALLLISSLCSTGAELVTNGDFETGDFTGWTQYNYNGGTPIPSTVQTATVHTGTYAVEVNATGNKEGGVYQAIATTPGENIRFGVWVKSTGFGFVYVGYSTTGSTNPKSGTTWEWGKQIANWTYVEMDFTAQASTATIWLNAWNDKGWYDGVTTEFTGNILGTVTDASTTLPIPGVSVATLPVSHSAVTDGSGQFLMESVAASTYTLQYRDYRYLDFDKPNVLVEPDGTADGSAQLTARGLGSITGFVRKASDNSPLEGARVWVAVEGLPEDTLEAFTNASGAYTISDVPENTYTVHCRATGYEEQAPIIIVSAGPATDKDWSLVWRVVNPTNALTNAGFEDAEMAPWTEWAATHWQGHQNLDDDCLFGDQFLGAEATVQRLPTGGVGGTGAIQIGLAGGDSDAACGGVRQQAYVEPGKYYRVRADFKGSIPADMAMPGNDFEIALGLVDGRFDPGVYSSPFEPTPFAHDVVKMQCHANWFGANLVPEPEMPWHNMMASRASAYDGAASWDWTSTLEWPARRNLLVGGVKKATSDIMTVVLYIRASYDIWNYDPPYAATTALFDNVVLEEVSGYPSFSLADLNMLDSSPPFHDYPDKYPAIKVDLSNPQNAKVVTGQFLDEMNSFFYIEEMDRSAGIRVIHDDFNVWPAPGNLANFTGTIGYTISPDYTLMERVIVADLGSVAISPGSELPKPYGVSPRDVSAASAYFDPLGQSGPHNIGLLVKTWGTVVSATGPDSYGKSWLQINEGSGKSVWVAGQLPEPDPNAYVGKLISAKGVVGISWIVPGYPAMTILMPDETAADDFEVLKP